jgi:hypothetical protein
MSAHEGESCDVEGFADFGVRVSGSNEYKAIRESVANGTAIELAVT